MLPNISLTRPIITQCFRNLATTSQLGFKFKLTEEMSREFEEKKKAEMKPESPQALHTKENTLIMGKVSSDRYKNVIKVGVPKHRLNEVLLLYIRENDDVQALDAENICKPGDWVLLRRDPNPIDKRVTHTVEKIVHSRGHYVDPLTNRRTFGIYYDDEVTRLEKIKMEF